MSHSKITVSSRKYHDSDDCLTAAETEFASEHGLAGWDLSPEWLDDSDRDWIVLTVPVTRYEIRTGPEHHSGDRAWMRLASTVTVDCKNVGAWCYFDAETTDAAALEAALELDDDVVEYTEVEDFE